MRLGFFASGRGSNLQAIVDACTSGVIDATPVVVISNNSSAVALDRARLAGIDTAHLSSVTHPDADLLDKTICAELTSHDVDVVVLAGYMKKLGPLTLETFRSRILNVHPSLLPAFGGKGMWGMHVHQAVIDSGVRQSGVSLHLVDGDYDTGPVIAQRTVDIHDNDTAETLAARLLPEEHKLYVDTLARIARGDVVLPTA